MTRYFLEIVCHVSVVVATASVAEAAEEWPAAALVVGGIIVVFDIA